MKKYLALIASAILALSFSACANSEKDDTASSESSVSSQAQDGGESSLTEGEQADTAAPLELLTTIWNSYGEEDKFPAAGGDMSEENMTMDAPGKYGLEDTAALDSALGFPTASADMIDDAASLVHMMNANTFTCGAYHLKNAADTDAVASAIKDNIMNRQWLCGFPDKLVIATADGCVIAFFGENEIADTFKAKMTEAYQSAQIVCEEAIG